MITMIKKKNYKYILQIRFLKTLKITIKKLQITIKNCTTMIIKSLFCAL